MHAFVAGHPIKHSKSPLIHGTWLKRHGLEGTYRAVDVAPEDFEAFMASLKAPASEFVGGNITIPHKERAFALADEVDETADYIGAANTLWREDGRLKATNTDAYGFAANLDEKSPGWETLETAVVYGAGGASRAVIVALVQRGFRTVHVLNRTTEKAKALADRFGATVQAHGLQTLDEVLQGAGLFVNTTSLGLEDDAVPQIDFTGMRQGALVTDIVYVPLKTAFLEQAEAQGIATADGLGMLLHQAVPGFEKWFGVRPVVDRELRDIVEAAMGVR
ncbi:shikimate dehydrogenase [Rhizobium sp. C4]|uniref:shikimate dehydrogenase n=1 Tax=Rhizobium sp. C4 TaxID=1349800 RepID=UPI001E4C3AC4|nr:shikimate dehydrogenase [Rhizobium sp. C4]MCD2174693.1 shikimate dehydrogenase [Rhizobium sp. C4]